MVTLIVLELVENNRKFKEHCKCNGLIAKMRRILRFVVSKNLFSKSTDMSSMLWAESIKNTAGAFTTWKEYHKRSITQLSPYLRSAEQLTFCIPPLGRIWIWTWTKIESVCSRHLTNPSTWFCGKMPTTFWNIMLHIVFGPISQWWRIIKKKILGAIPSPKSNQFVLVTHTPKLSTKFSPKPTPTLWDILLTDRQTDRDRCEKVIIWTVRPTIHIIELIKR